jgi:hypothetical protein
MRVRSNLTNRRFGLLLAIAPAGQAQSGKIIWACRCDCGNEASVQVDNLTGGHTRSCGCLVSKCKRTPEEGTALKNAVTRDWNRRNVTHVTQYRRNRTLLSHNISPERHEALLVEQNGVCAICKRPPETFGVKHLDIDHDHRCCPGTYSCGKCIRGLICIACNRALGLFQDRLDILQSAANYIAMAAPIGAVETERGIAERRKLQSELHGDMQSAAEMTAPAKIN